MKFTLLEMTQNVLSRMSSDEVNSIGDTTESMQIATIIQNKYFDIINRVSLPEHSQLVQLDPSMDATQPVLMYVPTGVADIKWIKYFNSNVLDNANTNDHDINVDIVAPWTTTSTTTNTIALGTHTFTVSAGLSISVQDTAFIVSGVNTMTGTVTSYGGTTLVINVTDISGSGTYSTWVISQDNGAAAPPGYQYVTILAIEQFIDMVNKFNPAENNVESFTFADTSNNFPGNYTFYYKNDRQPRFCTVLSNYYIIFDSFDETQDTTLQGSKTMAWGRVIPVFNMSDSFIPDLAEEQFQLLLNEATALAFYELKQQPHALAAQEIQRGWSNVQKNKAVTNRPTYFNEFPNFGRHGRGFNSQVSYFKARGWDPYNG